MKASYDQKEKELIKGYDENMKFKETQYK